MCLKDNSSRNTNLLKIQNTHMNFIVILAFVIVAVLFVTYFLNQPKQTTQTHSKNLQNI